MFNQKGDRMRKTIIVTMCITILSFGMIDSQITSEINYIQLMENDRLRKETEELRIKKYHEDELNRFLNDIGFRESGNRYDITNTWGYMGKYQFGKSTLKGLGFEVTRKEFLNNPQLQEEAHDGFYYYTTKKNYKSILIYSMVKQSMVCIFQKVVYWAHLGGQGSVKDTLKMVKFLKMLHGTKITSYMKQFSGYDIKLN